MTLATIGASIESGALQTVLLEPGRGQVLAAQVSRLEPDAATALSDAIASMQALASSRDVQVDAVGVVYRTEAERSAFAAALENEGVESSIMTVHSAAASFLRWLARNEEFAGVGTVLLYYMGEAGVSVSIADAADASITEPKTASLDSMTPERIGSTIPLAWEAIDTSGKKPEAVALFGDKSSSRDLVDILSLGLAVPVVRVGDADRIAACGAALLAHRATSTKPAPPVAAKTEVAEPPAPKPSVVKPARTAVSTNAVAATTTAATPAATKTRRATKPAPAVFAQTAAERAAEGKPAAPDETAAVDNPKAVPGATSVAVAETVSLTKSATSDVTESAQSSMKPATDARLQKVPRSAVSPARVAAAAMASPVASAPKSVVTDRRGSRNKLVFAAVLLAGVLSAGVAVAATMPTDSVQTPAPAAERAAETDATDATATDATATDATVTDSTDTDSADADPATGIAVPAIVGPPVDLPPPPPPALLETGDVPSTGQAPVTQQAPRQAVAAPPAPTASPAPAPSTVDAPQFTVPPTIPEPGKSQEQLEQEAWDRHWQQTGQWISQEIHGR